MAMCLHSLFIQKPSDPVGIVLSGRCLHAYHSEGKRPDSMTIAP